jgi:hypothetical protein
MRRTRHLLLQHAHALTVAHPPRYAPATRRRSPTVAAEAGERDQSDGRQWRE